MNYGHRPVIQNTSRSRHHKIDGLVDSALVYPSQRQMVEGIITHVKEPRGASSAPIRAEGSYVGAPTMPRGSHIKAFDPKTKKVAGHIMPVGQN